jgi:hypothetical protein
MVGKKDADLDEKGFITSTQEELIYLNNKGIKIKDRNHMLATIEIFHLYIGFKTYFKCSWINTMYSLPPSSTIPL